MRQSRTKRAPSTIVTVTKFRQDLLIALARYRYLDSKHLKALCDWHGTPSKDGLRALFDAGLIAILDNRTFQRSTLKDALVYEITKDGLAYLSAQGIEVKKTTWLRGGSYKTPLHDLNLNLAICSFEIECIQQGWKLYTWDEVLERAPETTRKQKRPQKFNGIEPDALFVVEGPDDCAFFALEMDITNHGKAEYKEKYAIYDNFIFKDQYKSYFDMTQDMYVLTICSNLAHLRDTLFPAMPPLAKNLLFKVHPSYGKFQKPPAPAPELFSTEWHRANRVPLKLGDILGHTEARPHPRTDRPQA